MPAPLPDPRIANPLGLMQIEGAADFLVDLRRYEVCRTLAPYVLFFLEMMEARDLRVRVSLHWAVLLFSGERDGNVFELRAWIPESVMIALRTMSQGEASPWPTTKILPGQRVFLDMLWEGAFERPGDIPERQRAYISPDQYPNIQRFFQPEVFHATTSLVSLKAGHMGALVDPVSGKRVEIYVRRQCPSTAAFYQDTTYPVASKTEDLFDNPTFCYMRRLDTF